MTIPGLHIRRARRTDFTAVMHLLAASGLAVPPPDRATLRRFRNLVADLGGDFYLVLVDATLSGLVHVTYARQLARPPRAVLDELVVAAAFRRRGLASALLAFVCERARRRGCTEIWCATPTGDAAMRRFLATAGMRPRGEWVVRTLDPSE